MLQDVGWSLIRCCLCFIKYSKEWNSKHDMLCLSYHPGEYCNPRIYCDRFLNFFSYFFIPTFSLYAANSVSSIDWIILCTILLLHAKNGSVFVNCSIFYSDFGVSFMFLTQVTVSKKTSETALATKKWVIGNNVLDISLFYVPMHTP